MGLQSAKATPPPLQSKAAEAWVWTKAWDKELKAGQQPCLFFLPVLGSRSGQAAGLANPVKQLILL
jgi:hypothetical protein